MSKKETLFTSLIGCLFLITLSVVLVLNCRILYYYDISAQNLVETTGYSEEIIRENYDVLIDYNLIGKRVKVLEFPDFPMSESGKIHFEEVRDIFLVIQYVCYMSGLLYLILLVQQICDGHYKSLKFTAVFSLIIPIILGTLAVLFWDKVFVIFHKLCFRNDYWLFDPVTDPIINILPDAFFFHCAIAIVSLILVGSLLCWIFYWYLQRRNNCNERKKNNK